MPHEYFIAYPNAWDKFLADLADLTAPQAKAPLFISYAWPTDPDERAQLHRWLLQLQGDLQRLGYSVFLDLTDMHGHLNTRMEQAIHDSGTALVIGTPRYADRAVDDSTAVAFEWQRLLAKAQQGQLTLLPLMYAGDFCTAFPAQAHPYLIRDCCAQARYVTQMMALHSPLGILPALLDFHRGHAGYEALLTAYRTATLSNLPACNPDFAGREAMLAHLYEALQGGPRAITQAHTVVGLGGLGKSQLAIEYAHRHRAAYQICRWVLAEGKTLKTSMDTLAISLGLDPQGMPQVALVEGIYAALNSYGHTLLIFDNADTPEALKAYLPRQQHEHLHILITSRSQRWRHQVTLAVFDQPETLAYLQTQLTEAGLPFVESEAQALRDTLGGLPLALAQAVAYMSQTHLGMAEYLRLFKQTPLAAFETHPLDEAGYPETVATTWQVSVNRLQQTHPQAVNLLHACAFLAPDDVPLGLCEQWFSGTLADFHRALKALRDYSLIQTGSQPHLISVHRLVQCVTQAPFMHRQAEGMTYTEDAQKILHALSATLRAYCPWDNISEEDWTRTRLLLPHLEFVMAHLDNASAHAPSETKAALALAYVEVNAYRANALGALGDAKGKKALFERALVIKEAHYGPDHVNVAITLVGLGNALGALGDAKGQKALLERALVIEEAHYGPDHVSVAITLVNLSNALGDLGDAKGQKALLERALVIKEAHYGPDHVNVARTLGNLGNALGALGDAKGQKALLERALVIEEAYYGPDHVNVAGTLVNLGSALGDLGDAKGQKALLERALVIQEAHYGPDHVNVAITLVGLGRALGDAKGQKALLERALVIQEAHYGPDHVNVASTLVNLSNALGDLGDAKGQKALLERALVIQEAHYGPDHVNVASTLGNLGNALGALGDAKGQKALLERALVIQEAHYGPDHVNVARTLGNLGNALGALGDAKGKKALLERALVIEEAHYGPDHLEVARTLGGLGNALGDLGDAKGKKALLERALVIKEAHYGPDHVNVASTLSNLGNALGALADAKGKKALLERALVIEEAHYGPDHVNVASTLGNLGNALGALGDAKGKKALLERALVIKEAHYGPDHVEVAITLFGLADAHERLGDTPQATQDFSRAYQLFNTHYSHAHQHTRLAHQRWQALLSAPSPVSHSPALFQPSPQAPPPAPLNRLRSQRCRCVVM